MCISSILVLQLAPRPIRAATCTGCPGASYSMHALPSRTAGSYVYVMMSLLFICTACTAITFPTTPLGSGRSDTWSNLAWHPRSAILLLFSPQSRYLHTQPLTHPASHHVCDMNSAHSAQQCATAPCSKLVMTPQVPMYLIQPSLTQHVHLSHGQQHCITHSHFTA